MDAVYIRNALNTQEQRRFAFSAGTLRSQLVSRNIAIAYFTAASIPTNAGMHYVLHCYSVGRCILKHVQPNTCAGTIAALEAIAPKLPNDSFANEAESRRIFVHSIIAFLQKHGWQNHMIDLGDNTIEDVYNASTAAEGTRARFMMGHEALDQDHATCVAAFVQNVGTLPLMAEALCRVLDYMYTQYATARARSIGANAYTLAYVAMGKRGTISENNLNRLRTGIQTECNKTIFITVQEVEVFYREMRGIIDHNNAQAILNRLSGNMTNFSLRLRLTIDQAIKGGMTSYRAIHSAFKSFPNFPWATARRYLELDFTRFQNACALVGNNEYYSFNPNLGEAAATRYKSLSWLCMHLLVRHLRAEYGTLTQYATYNRVPDHQAQLQALIDGYVPVVPEEDAAATQEVLDAFRTVRLGH